MRESPANGERNRAQANSKYMPKIRGSKVFLALILVAVLIRLLQLNHDTEAAGRFAEVRVV